MWPIAPPARIFDINVRQEGPDSEDHAALDKTGTSETERACGAGYFLFCCAFRNNASTSDQRFCHGSRSSAGSLAMTAGSHRLANEMSG